LWYPAADYLDKTPKVRPERTYALQRGGELRYLWARVLESTLESAKAGASPQPGQVTVKLHVERAGSLLDSGLVVNLVVEAPAEGSGDSPPLTAVDETHTFPVQTGDRLWFQVTTEGTGQFRGLDISVDHPPPAVADVNAWIPDAHIMSIPTDWDSEKDNPVSDADPDLTLTWNQLAQVVAATEGDRVSPGVIQTLISTADESLAWVERVVPEAFPSNDSTPGKIPGVTRRPPRLGRRLDFAEYFKNWLPNGANSVLAGAAFVRMGYAGMLWSAKQQRWLVATSTRFDLPLVGGAYNAHTVKAPQGPASAPGWRWGVHTFGGYTEIAAPYHNAAVAAFNAGTASPPPSVRFVK